MEYSAEIIAVGTELLLGSIANTDAQSISQGLSELGINCYFHTTVGDNPVRLKEAVAIAKSRANIIITTGGLGPTYDDLTKQTLAEAFNCAMQFNADVWQRIEKYFCQIGRELTENNRQQAYLPENCTILQNDWGTAPGCAFLKDNCHVIMLPGPPKECTPMFRSCAMPYLAKLSDKVFVSRNVRIFGMGESQVETKLRDLMTQSSNPTIAPYAGQGEMYLRVTASASNHDQAFALTQPVVKTISETIGEHVYGVDVDDMESLVVELLDKSSKTLALAESCTGGMIAARITNVSGASKHFLGGVCVYHTDMKVNLLGVDSQLINQKGVVSAEVAQAMAIGVCEKTGADIGLGVTGLAGPNGDGSQTAVGTVYLALYDKKTDKIVQLHGNFGDERNRVRQMACNHALNLIIKHLNR